MHAYHRKKKEDNQVWAKENGKKPLNHLLWPRAKAFLMSVEFLGDTIEYVYDATIAFEKEVSVVYMHVCMCVYMYVCIHC